MALEAFFAEECSFYEAVNLLHHTMNKPVVTQTPYVEPPWKRMKTLASEQRQPANTSSQADTATTVSSSSGVAASAALNTATAPGVVSSAQPTAVIGAFSKATSSGSAKQPAIPAGVPKGKGKANKGSPEMLAYYAAERKAAEEAGLRWQDRGPPGPKDGGPETWRGQNYRPNSGRWSNRGGGNRDWYQHFHFLIRQGFDRDAAKTAADERFPKSKPAAPAASDP
jgi:hypothetical protein